MQAGRAEIGRVLPFMQVTAIAAAPYHLAVALEHPAGLEVLGCGVNC